jgi:L-lactate utilization protein LutB
MNYLNIPEESVIESTVEELEKRGIQVSVVDNKTEALEEIKNLIPKSSKVTNGSSTTLRQIGYIEYLKTGKHGWTNLQEKILLEKDYIKQSELRRMSITDADYYLGSINAISANGELVAVDATGSRVGAYPFAAKKIVLVAGVQKIVPDIKEAMERIKKYVFPLENERAQKEYGMGSSFGKWVIIENELNSGRIKLILVKEVLGF